jgi:hypothetical protein
MAGVWAGLGIRCDWAKRKMIELGAISEETAKKPEELGFDEFTLNHYLARIRGIKRTEDGRYYVKSNDD